MLAQSDRRGCAMGAAIALVLDWRAVRHVLDIAAIRVGLEPHLCDLPDRAATLEVAGQIGGDDAIDRAILFGTRQLLNQHRGLWDVLQARAGRSEEHTSELQSLMRISYAVFCLKKKK